MPPDGVGGETARPEGPLSHKIIRPALSGRVLLSLLPVWPAIDLFRTPQQRLVDLFLVVSLSFFAIYLWRLHLYADKIVVSYRGGLRSFDARTSEIAAMAFSSPVPANLSFLAVDGSPLLKVPIAMTLPARQLMELADYLNIPVFGQPLAWLPRGKRR